MLEKENLLKHLQIESRIPMSSRSIQIYLKFSSLHDAFTSSPNPDPPRSLNFIDLIVVFSFGIDGKSGSWSGCIWMMTSLVSTSTSTSSNPTTPTSGEWLEWGRRIIIFFIYTSALLSTAERKSLPDSSSSSLSSNSDDFGELS